MPQIARHLILPVSSKMRFGNKHFPTGSHPLDSDCPDTLAALILDMMPHNVGGEACRITSKGRGFMATITNNAQ